MEENKTRQRDMTNVPYDPEWPHIFDSLKQVILQAYPQAVTIEHVGSTAIPGMPAKPRIDLDVIIKNETELPAVTSALATLGYFPQGDLGRPGREAFGRENEQVPYDGSGTTWMKHNLYVCPQDSPVLREHLLFRDYLRTHPEFAQEYHDLKEELSTEFKHDQNSYVAGKTAFVNRVLQEAQG